MKHVTSSDPCFKAQDSLTRNHQNGGKAKAVQTVKFLAA